MPRIARAGSLSLVIVCLGCSGGSPTTDPGKAPPHGGTIVALPGDAGFVEVVGKAGASSATAGGEATFYFFKDRSYTPYTPAPTSGTLTIGKGKPVALKADSDALTTPPGPPLFKSGEPEGALSVEMNGKTQTVNIGLR